MQPPPLVESPRSPAQRCAQAARHCTLAISNNIDIFKFDAPTGATDRVSVRKPWRRSAERWPQAVVASAACPPREAPHRSTGLPVACHAASAAWCPLAAESPVHPRVPVEHEHGERARRIPRLPLFDPARSRPPSGGIGRQGGARARNEVDRGARGACGESSLPPQRRGSLRPLSPARAAFAARGAPRARVCPAQRSEALAAAVRVGTARCPRRRLVRCLVRRMEAPSAVE